MLKYVAAFLWGNKFTVRFEWLNCIAFSGISRLTEKHYAGCVKIVLMNEKLNVSKVIYFACVWCKLQTASKQVFYVMFQGLNAHW